jgi:hypothetical protein
MPQDSRVFHRLYILKPAPEAGKQNEPASTTRLAG